MSEALKPCPFCGGSAFMRREACPDGGGYFAFIECKDCRARSGNTYYSRGNDCPQTYSGRREAWNTRADTAQELIAACRAEVDARALYLATAPDRGGMHGLKGQRKQALEAAQARTVAALHNIEGGA